ncbi:hypothetical protein [Halomonas korlensis]|uniref:Uncharacterized protein n=1 Tax=Halomonas korlensis TaxID=463301 RepID=A0A1I7FWY9_9GAMM|nr:hypothetical protein [Halomonas korlensis]SFU40752.1 hypothetical protein SAMN04487955_10264 [Halomonas korlensis]
MTAYDLLQMLTYGFHLVGLLVCLAGLSLARRPERRLTGRAVAVFGFLIAVAPVLMQLFGVIEPAPMPSLPPR